MSRERSLENLALQLENESLKESLKPKLEISFEPKEPFIEDYSGLGGDIFYQLRRIAITSSVPATVRVMVPVVKIDGIERVNVYLRKINREQRDELHPGIAGYWDVVRTDSANGEIALMRERDGPRNLGRESEFQIYASCSNSPMVSKKWVTVKVDKDEKLNFELREGAGSTQKNLIS